MVIEHGNGNLHIRLPIDINFPKLVIMLCDCGMYTKLKGYHLFSDSSYVSIYWTPGSLTPQRFPAAPSSLASYTSNGNYLNSFDGGSNIKGFLQ